MKLVRSECGQSLIEFAVYLPVLLFMVSGIVDYSMYIQAAMQVQAAAAAGASYGTIPGNETNTTTMQTWAKYAANNSSMGVSNFAVTATNEYSCSAAGTLTTTVPTCASNAPYAFVQVRTSGAFSPLIGFTKITGPLTLHGFAQYEVP